MRLCSERRRHRAHPGLACHSMASRGALSRSLTDTVCTPGSRTRFRHVFARPALTPKAPLDPPCHALPPPPGLRCGTARCHPSGWSGRLRGSWFAPGGGEEGKEQGNDSMAAGCGCMARLSCSARRCTGPPAYTRPVPQAPVTNSPEATEVLNTCPGFNYYPDVSAHSRTNRLPFPGCAECSAVRPGHVDALARPCPFAEIYSREHHCRHGHRRNPGGMLHRLQPHHQLYDVDVVQSVGHGRRVRGPLARPLLVRVKCHAAARC